MTDASPHGEPGDPKGSKGPKGVVSQADEHGCFGEFGGRFVSEGLVAALEELLEATRTIVPSKAFRDELDYLLASYAGRPTPLTYA